MPTTPLPIQAKGHVKAALICSAGLRPVYDDHNDITSVAPSIITKALAGTGQPILDKISIHSSSSLNPEQLVDIVNISSVIFPSPNEVEFLAVFSPGNELVTIDEVRLVSAFLGTFSTVTSVVIVKAPGQALAIRWRLTISVTGVECASCGGTCEDGPIVAVDFDSAINNLVINTTDLSLFGETLDIVIPIKMGCCEVPEPTGIDTTFPELPLVPPPLDPNPPILVAASIAESLGQYYLTLSYNVAKDTVSLQIAYIRVQACGIVTNLSIPVMFINDTYPNEFNAQDVLNWFNS